MIALLRVVAVCNCGIPRKRVMIGQESLIVGTGYGITLQRMKAGTDFCRMIRTRLQEMSN